MRKQRTFVSCLAALVVTLGAAQTASVDVGSPAAQVVIRVSNALGIKLPEESLLEHLQTLEDRGIIDTSTRVSMQEALMSGQLSSSTLNIFLADVLNGQEPALSAQQAAEFLAALAVAVPDDPTVDINAINSVFNNPDFANAVGDAYDIPASPIDSAGN